jgi:hypothetical protein
MGQWVRCTLESDEKQGEQKLVRHLNLDYYVRMERNPNNTTLLRSVTPGLSDSLRATWKPAIRLHVLILTTGAFAPWFHGE